MYAPGTRKACVRSSSRTRSSRWSGTPANENARAYLIETLQLYGFDVRVQEADAAWREAGVTTRVANVIAIKPGQQQDAVALVSHYDSVAWGPGGWAGYTGNIYSQWGNRAQVSRYAGGYNAWTGNAWAGKAGASYNSRTGIASAGQRGAVGNVYSGAYAGGSRGVAGGDNYGVAGARGTVGNAYTGESVSGSRGVIYNKETGEVTRFGGVTGSDGGRVGHIGDDVYAGKDGNVYRNTGDGWQKHQEGGGWSDVPSVSPHLDAERSARQAGNERASQMRSSNSSARSFRSGGGGRGRR